MKSKKKGSNRSCYKVADGHVVKGQTVWYWSASANMPIPKRFVGPAPVQQLGKSIKRPPHAFGMFHGSKTALHVSYANDRYGKPYRRRLGCLIQRPSVSMYDLRFLRAALPRQLFESFDACCKANGIIPDLAKSGANHLVKVGITIGRSRLVG